MATCVEAGSTAWVADSTQPAEKRGTSTVAPQALFLLNSTFVRKQSLALAERLARTLDAGITDLASGQGDKESLQQEIDALEVLAKLERAEGARLVVHGVPEIFPVRLVTPRSERSNAK